MTPTTPKITREDLVSSYQDAIKKNGLIDLVKELRAGVILKLHDLNACFSGALWIKSSQRTGHRKLAHKVTRVVIEYQNHGRETIAPHIQAQILMQTQNHLNILCNKIFAYKTRNWKTEPNFDEALKNCV